MKNNLPFILLIAISVFAGVCAVAFFLSSPTPSLSEEPQESRPQPSDVTYCYYGDFVPCEELESFQNGEYDGGEYVKIGPYKKFPTAMSMQPSVTVVSEGEEWYAYSKLMGGFKVEFGETSEKTVAPEETMRVTISSKSMQQSNCLNLKKRPNDSTGECLNIPHGYEYVETPNGSIVKLYD